MEKLRVILNPRAGRGVAGKRRSDLERALYAARLPFELVETAAPGDGALLTRQALEEGVGRLVAVGGDGTIHEIANAMLQHQGTGQTALGMIPIGTGNDFIKSFEGLAADDLAGAVERLANGRIQPIDAGRVQITGAETSAHAAGVFYFINNLALGIDAYVAAEANRLQRLRGLAAYMVGAARALRTYKAQPITIRFDGKEMQHPFLLATIANGRCQGGGFWFTPTALLDDGLFDLCMVEKLRPDQIVRYLPRAMQGTHTDLPRVHMANANHITIDYTTPALIITDGEVAATDALHVDVQVLPRALQIIA